MLQKAPGIAIILLSIFCNTACNKATTLVPLTQSSSVYKEAAEDDWMESDVIVYHQGQVSKVQDVGIDDPLEKVNRAMFNFNMAVDLLFIKPVAKVYNVVVPDIGKGMIRNFLNHIASPLRLLYQVITFDMREAGVTVARFAVNTVFGTLGLNDPASRYPSLRYCKITGDNVLKSYGGKSGPYIILPFIGSSTARGSFGILMDLFMNPLNWTMSMKANIIKSGLDLIDIRSSVLGMTTDIDNISLDSYAMTRSIYLQYKR